MIDLFLLFL